MLEFAQNASYTVPTKGMPMARGIFFEKMKQTIQ